MKILHVITSLQTGGAEKLLVDLLPRLREKGHEVELLLFDGVTTPFRKKLEERNLKVYDLGSNHSVYSPVVFVRLLKFLRKHKYDVIHTHNTAPQYFVALSKLIFNLCILTTEHSTFNRRRKWIGFRLLDSLMYKRYKKIICISDKASINLNKYIFLGERLITIDNGINTELFNKATPLKELDEIAPNSKKIIMVAGLRWEKDQATLIKSLKYLPAQFHLFLVGEGVMRPELEHLVETLHLSERVTFLGLRNDIPSLLKASDYIVMSSHFEGLSLSSIEGMCVGKPFIASDVDGLREVVTGAGVLFTHGDSENLAENILKLEKEPEYRQLISDKCLQRARKFDISETVKKYDQLYRGQ